MCVYVPLRVGMKESSEEPVSPDTPSSSKQHDNYINYDIAQIVVKESRNEDPGIISPGETTTQHHQGF